MPSHCDKYADWTEENSDGPIAFPKTVLTSFSLPLSSELLFLVSNSSKSRGIVRITKNGLPGSSDVLVDVRMTYHYDEVFEYTKICSAQLDDGEYGVALFDIREVPKGRKYYTDFEITVNIPPSTTGVPTFIRGFRGDMLLFAYELGYMQDFVFFDTISLDAGNMSINAMALSARSANLHNERAEISGSFNVSELLVLHAVASLITVDVKLLNTDQDNPTELQMCTFFSDIRVTLELISTSETGTGGAFKVNASTDFRPVDIQTIRAPIDHVLDLTVQTKGGEITVTLPSTWEGEFRAASAPILGGPRIEADKNVPDPSGRGRKRDLAWVGNEPGVVEGHAWWVPQEERDSKMGNVTIVSAYLSPILRF
ncbi:hypothetical protein CERSUDRAFT_98869 [Gelatoporia subvermispora B]|uniref:Uncharacterized protein n=1 Tax=Ceriporiopsis subvermispora (strain B) TaxID=914234 RepID=M2R2Z2_CERS8|nr:hypothetical protein CERSUDRAFT_98869 [Gelatoporia subvermispora B]